MAKRDWVTTSPLMCVTGQEVEWNSCADLCCWDNTQLCSEVSHSFFPGGTLRIYADSLKPNIPYKTILLSTTDPADFAVAEALEKYGLEKENPKDYCIARVGAAQSVPSSAARGRTACGSGQRLCLFTCKLNMVDLQWCVGEKASLPMPVKPGLVFPAGRP